MAIGHGKLLPPFTRERQLNAGLTIGMTCHTAHEYVLHDTCDVQDNCTTLLTRR
jgi:hypothetical protein